jgi:hypothetical protein
MQLPLMAGILTNRIRLDHPHSDYSISGRRSPNLLRFYSELDVCAINSCPSVASHGMRYLKLSHSFHMGYEETRREHCFKMSGLSRQAGLHSEWLLRVD